MAKLDRFKIRQRERRGGSAPGGLRHEWTEHQVVDGNKVIARLGTEDEAQRWLAAHRQYLAERGVSLTDKGRAKLAARGCACHEDVVTHGFHQGCPIHGDEWRGN